MAAHVPDMITLPDLSQQSIMANLRARAAESLIYTYTGSILVAVNPYRRLPLYSPEHIARYKNKRIGEEDPHIFALADSAYRSMVDFGENQSMIISGESGAGKTETTKIILQYLSSMSTRHTAVEQMVLETSPILEAFGNAATVRNDNSSRFGKYIQLKFDERFSITGARIIPYLLEKSRIVSQAEGERNFHAFYALIRGAPPEFAEELGISGRVEDFHYTSQSGRDDIDGFDDATNFTAISNALTFLEMDEDTQSTIWRMLGGVLHLGNLQFSKEKEGSKVDNMDTLSRAATLIGVSVEKLATAITVRTNKIRGEVFRVPLTMPQAESTRDTLAKTLYQKLFDWLVEFINEKIANEDGSGGAAPIAAGTRFIGVLDIFGFENFAHNSFEQLCIDYTNEKLQNLFNKHIFKQEQEEYEKEGINWSHIEFVDNQDTLDLIEGPLGVLKILDEETQFPKGSDESFLAKLVAQHDKKQPRFMSDRFSRTAFVIKHYAGEVKYDVTDFLSKNREKLLEDLEELLQSSTDDFIRVLFGGKVAAPSGPKKPAEGAGRGRGRGRGRGGGGRGGGGRGGGSLGVGRGAGVDEVSASDMGSVSEEAEAHAKKLMGAAEAAAPGSPAPSTRRQSGLLGSSSTSRPSLAQRRVASSTALRVGQTATMTKEKTIAAKFKKQLAQLMETLSSTQPWYCRCVKPNSTKSPTDFEEELVLDQLLYAGMLETIRIRKNGFPVRQVIAEFARRYKVLAAERGMALKPDPLAMANDILNSIAVDPSMWQVGKTKVFMREQQLAKLEDERKNVLVKYAVKIQRVARGFLVRLRLGRQRKAQVVFAKYFRRYAARKRFLQQRRAVLRLQKWVRRRRAVRLAKAEANARRNAIAVLQREWRAALARHRYLATRTMAKAFGACAIRYLVQKDAGIVPIGTKAGSGSSASAAPAAPGAPPPPGGRAPSSAKAPAGAVATGSDSWRSGPLLLPPGELPPVLTVTDDDRKVFGIEMGEDAKIPKAPPLDLDVPKNVFLSEFYSKPHLAFVSVDKSAAAVQFVIVARRATPPERELDMSDMLKTDPNDPQSGWEHRAMRYSSKGLESFTISNLGLEPAKTIQEQLLAALGGPSAYHIVTNRYEFSPAFAKVTKAHPVGVTTVKIAIIRSTPDAPEGRGVSESSPDFDRFCQSLGSEIDLSTWTGYRGDFGRETTGKTYFTRFRDVEVMFHVSTLLDAEGHRRLIGNDVAVIFFRDQGSKPLDIGKVDLGTVPQVHAVVQPFADKKAGKTRYALAVYSRSAVKPAFGPAIPANRAFRHGTEMREFLLTKMINGTQRALDCPPMNRLVYMPRGAALEELAGSFGQETEKQRKDRQKAEADARRKLRDDAAPDAAQELIVTVMSARDIAANDGVFVSLVLEEQEHKTAVVKKTAVPSFAETFTLSLLGVATDFALLKLELLSGSGKKFCGQVHLSITECLIEQDVSPSGRWYDLERRPMSKANSEKVSGQLQLKFATRGVARPSLTPLEAQSAPGGVAKPPKQLYDPIAPFSLLPVSLPNGDEVTPIGFVEAMCDFAAVEEGELSFLAGDVLFLLERDEDGWWQGVFNNEVGFFPGNGVQELTPVGTAIALTDFTGEEDAEMDNFTERDMLVILTQEEDGWWMGANYSNSKTGFIPGNGVQLLPTLPEGANPHFQLTLDVELSKFNWAEYRVVLASQLGVPTGKVQLKKTVPLQAQTLVIIKVVDSVVGRTMSGALRERSFREKSSISRVQEVHVPEVAKEPPPHPPRPTGGAAAAPAAPGGPPPPPGGAPPPPPAPAAPAPPPPPPPPPTGKPTRKAPPVAPTGAVKASAAPSEAAMMKASKAVAETIRLAPAASTPAAPVKEVVIAPECPAIILDEVAADFAYDKLTAVRFDALSAGSAPFLKHKTPEDAEAAKKMWQILTVKLAPAVTAEDVAALFAPAQRPAAIGLRDELYCQALTAMHEGKRNAWQILALVCSAIAPSEEIARYAAGALVEHREESDPNHLAARFCARVLCRTVAHGSRRYPPSREEVTQVCAYSHIRVTTHTLDGAQRVLLVDGATTAGEVAAALEPGFTMFEVYNRLERSLRDDETIADALSKFDSFSDAMAKKNVRVAFRFLYKKKLFGIEGDMPNDPGHSLLLYHQAYSDIMHSRLPVPDPAQLARIGALSLAIHGNKELSDSAMLTKVVPASLCSPAVETKVKEELAKVGGKAVPELVSEYLSIVTKLEYYGSCIVSVRHQSDVLKGDGLPAKFDLVISCRWVRFCTPGEGKKAIVTLKYSEIDDWAVEKKSVRINDKYELFTLQGVEIASLLQAYTDFHASKSNWCRAISEYKVADPNLLQLHVGDIVKILERTDEAWFTGECEGAIGLFPRASVEVVLTEFEKSKRAPASGSGDTPKLPPRSPAAKIAASAKNADKAVPKTNTIKKSTGTAGDRLALIEFAKANFRSPKVTKGKLIKTSSSVSLDAYLLYATDPITDSLLSAVRSKDGVTLFIQVMKFMGDYPTKAKSKVPFAIDIVKRCLASDEPLADEAYCQVMKQLTANPNAASFAMGVELLCVLACSLKPSKALYPYIMAFVETLARGLGDDLAKFLRNSLERGHFSAIKQRLSQPSVHEISAVRKGQPIVMRIRLSDETAKAVYIDSWTTVKSAEADVRSKTKISDIAGEGWRLLEVHVKSGQERVLGSDELLVDIISSWGDATSDFEIMFKKAVFPLQRAHVPNAKDDKLGLHLMYSQACSDLYYGFIILVDEAALGEAMACQLAITGATSADAAESVTPQHLQPPSDKLVASVKRSMSTLSSLSPPEVQSKLLELVHKSPLYGVSLFDVDQGKKSVWLGISAMGVGVYEPFSTKTTSFVAYDEIINWATKKNSVTFAYGDAMRPNKLFFAVTEFQSRAINTLTTLYTK